MVGNTEAVHARVGFQSDVAQRLIANAVHPLRTDEHAPAYRINDEATTMLTALSSML
jgi:hypothetical protein